MHYRIFGNTGETVSEIGLGTWQFGGDWGAMDDKSAQEVLTSAVERSINFIDTADVYGMGKSESYIGRALKDHPQKIFIATKLGRAQGYPDSYSLALFRECVEGSLRRLGVEVLDLVQLHCIPKQYLADGEVFEWLRILQREGKIRFFGASVETDEEALLCMQQNDLTSLQIIFNVFRQKPITEIFDMAHKQGVALIVRLPLSSGVLTGKFTTESRFTSTDHRNYNRDGQHFNVGETFSGIPFEKAVVLVNELKEMIDMPLTQFALRWILDFPQVAVVIPGAKNRNQVIENCKASDVQPLSSEIHQKTRALYDNKIQHLIRGAY